MNAPTPKPDGSRIARTWHEDKLIYEGVNLGRAITYDILQIVNRLVLSNYRPEAQPQPSNDPNSASPNA